MHKPCVLCDCMDVMIVTLLLLLSLLQQTKVKGRER
jgi:hypothetical protein